MPCRAVGFPTYNDRTDGLRSVMSAPPPRWAVRGPRKGLSRAREAGSQPNKVIAAVSPTSSPRTQWSTTVLRVIHHQVRHSTITHLSEDGVPLVLLMAKSRHVDLRTLERYARPEATLGWLVKLAAGHIPA